MTMEVQEQAATEMVSFRCKPQTKMLLHNRATALSMKISEYLNLIVQDYEDQRRQADNAGVESDTLRMRKGRRGHCRETGLGVENLPGRCFNCSQVPQ